MLGVLTSNVSNLTKLSESLAFTLLACGLVSRLAKLTKRRVARACTSRCRARLHAHDNGLVLFQFRHTDAVITFLDTANCGTPLGV